MTPTTRGQSAATDRDRRSRLPDGQLVALVLAHLREHPHTDFSPYELAKVLHRSHGAIRARLLRLADSDTVIRTRVRPARFQIRT